MKPQLSARIDELYQLPLPEFTAARATLAKTLSGKEKKDISTLAKPSLPMWVVNQLYWNDSATYNALVDAAEKLRAAHRAVLSGRTADTRKADELHRTTVDKAFAKALSLADKRGVRLTENVRQILRRTLAAVPSTEPAGRMTRPPEPAGFSLLAGITPRAFPKAPSPPVQKPPLRENRAAARAELKKQQRAERERKEAERKAELEKKKRERQILKAEQALRDAERRLAELKR
jgi:hypothetical protein